MRVTGGNVIVEAREAFDEHDIPVVCNSVLFIRGGFNGKIRRS